MTVFALAAGLVVAFVYCWPVALACLLTLPIMGAGLSMQMEVMLGTGDHAEGEAGEAGAVVGEVSLSIHSSILRQAIKQSSNSLIN